MQINWQLHPFTLTGHAFPSDAKPGDMSLCKREVRTNGSATDDAGIFPCRFCTKKIAQLKEKAHG